MRGRLILAALLLLIATMPLRAGMLVPIIFHATAGGGGGGCSNNGPLDVASATPIIAVGLRAQKKSYNSNLIQISTAGTTGTYNNVGLSGCDLNEVSFFGAMFTGSISTTTLTVTAVASGTINNGDTIVSNGANSVTASTTVSSGGPCSAASTPCTLTVNNSQTVGSESMGTNPLCSSTSAPTTTTGCPIKTWYDQSGNGCNPTQATGSAQAWLVVNQANTHSTAFFGGSQFYSCTLPGAKGQALYAGEFSTTDQGSSYGIAAMGDGTNTGTQMAWSIVAGAPAFASDDGTTQSFSPAVDDPGHYDNYIGYGPNSAGAYIIQNNGQGTPGSAVTNVTTGTSFELGAEQGNVAPGTFRLGEQDVFVAGGGCGTMSGDCFNLFNNQSAYW